MPGPQASRGRQAAQQWGRQVRQRGKQAVGSNQAAVQLPASQITASLSRWSNLQLYHPAAGHTGTGCEVDGDLMGIMILIIMMILKMIIVIIMELILTINMIIILMVIMIMTI